MSTAVYNKHNKKAWYQQRGTAIIARDQFAYRNHVQVYDSIGTWMIMSFRGKNVLSLRVVAAYRPQASSGLYSVYQQQVQHYVHINNNKDPISNVDGDLCSMIVDWIDNGDQVIVIIDANEDLTTTKKGIFRHKMEASGL